MVEHERLFSPGMVATILACYVASGLILWSLVGPWEAMRYSLVQGLLALAWLGLAGWLLSGLPQTKLPLSRRPAVELALLLAALLGMAAIAAARYRGQADIAPAFYYLLSYGTVLAVVLGFGYGWRSLGLALPPWRVWAAAIGVIGLNVMAAILFQILPAGEGVTPGGADLAAEVTGPLAAVALLVGLLLRGALPEELVLRVGMQPRLAAFVPAGWAIVAQALLFSAGHLPQELLRYDQPLLLSLGYLLPIENGLIAGYFWHRTQSLPVLILLHLFAFPRLGV